MWERSAKRSVDANGATVVEQQKKPCGPDLLLRMLGELRKLWQLQMQIEMEVMDHTPPGVITLEPVRMLYPGQEDAQDAL